MFGPKSLSFLVIVFFPLLQSCTAIGFFAGKSIDDKKPDTVAVSWGKINELDSNCRVSVIRRQGDTLVGKYLGLRHDLLEPYQQQLTAFCAGLSPSRKIPGPQDTLTVCPVQRTPYAATVQAYDYRTLFLRDHSHNNVEVPYDSIATVWINSAAMTGNEFHGLVAATSVPIISSMAMESVEEAPVRAFTIPLSNVDRVVYAYPKYGAVFGCLCGLVVDVAIIAVIAQEMRHMYSGKMF